ncbi:hypothetical protein K491DRAFT_660881 [Lophiostoma macrostomum CBS 122681]|uniref:Rhodopsin domain-containing protein n=1 Tax=Lophiostoma macrostomum CBS 122681 TaxID=1314788 RepID=A0A6A6T2K2_9PLEO|nr:hypothetical protein K491DRAFT_660881 [Lophiostoma macrostomum CBS 122681]
MAPVAMEQTARPPSHPAPMSREGRDMIISLSIVTFLATVICTSRMILRKSKGFLGFDDWLLLFALVLLYAQDGLNFAAAIKGGVGVHIEELMEHSIESLEFLFVILYACEVVYTVLIYVLKASILVSYKRVFGTQEMKWVNWAIMGMLGLCTIWFLTSLFMFVFQCRPISAAWKPLEVHGDCLNFIGFIWGMSISNFILDWMILCLPIIPVLKLQMSGLQKGLVIGSFLLGSLACIASTVRASLTSTLNSGDLSKSSALVMTWTVVEPACGIISACLPFLARIFGRKLRGTWTNVVRRTGGSNTPSYGGGKSKTGMPGSGVMKETTVSIRSTRKEMSPVEYEMGSVPDQQKKYQKLDEERESVRNLIP